MMTTTNPYADAFGAYWNAGWRGVLPLPHGAKTHPPTGYTGYNYTEPSYADCSAWSEEGPRNICLHLPRGVIGLDVDDYADKGGGATLAALVEECGPLPGTWLSTSRGDGISGIRLFTVPADARLITQLPGIEIIQAHHRYVVCWPSLHPSGSTYEWVDERTGEATLPLFNELPQLPQPWLVRLLKTGDAPSKADVTGSAITAFLEGLPSGEPCQHIQTAAGYTMRDGSRHDLYNGAILGVLDRGRSGCPGARETLKRLRTLFTAEVTAPGEGQRTKAEADAEWSRSIVGAVAISIEKHPEQGLSCPDDYLAELIITETQQAGQDTNDDGDQADSGEPPKMDQRTLEVARRASDMALTEDARSLLAAWKAGKLPELDGHILDVFLAQADEDEVYRIAKLWPLKGRVLLAAAAKAGKTTMVMNILRALADGGDFLGCFEAQPVPEGRTIVYLNLEVGANQMRRWMRRAEIVNTDRIIVVNLRGRIAALSLATEQGRARVAQWLRGLNAEVVILDPLAPLLASVGLSEDSNSDVAVFFGWWSSTMLDAEVSCDFIAHHAGWDGTRSRGASRLVDEPDAVWTISKDSAVDDDGDDIYDGQEPRFFKAIGRDVELAEQLLTFDGPTGTLKLGEGSRKQMKAAALGGQIEKAVVAKLKGGQSTQNDLCRRLGFSYQKVKDTLDELVERRIIVRQKLGQGYIYSLAATDTATDTETDIGTPAAPCQSPTHTPEGGVGATDKESVSVSVSVKACEDCGEDTGKPNFKICKPCEFKRRRPTR